MKPTRGALIVLEGLDRAGKSSQCRLLHDKLHSLGIPVRLIKFPDRTTPTGTLINSYLTNTTTTTNQTSSDHAIHLLFAANRWEALPSILASINSGVTVLIDRYAFSGAVYSAAKGNPSLTLEWAWAPEIGLPRPDVTLFLDLAPEQAAGRGGFGEERYETSAMQERVREGFGELFGMLGGGGNEEGGGVGVVVVVVDAGRSVEEVAEDVARPVLECIEGLGAAGPLERLGPLRSLKRG